MEQTSTLDRIIEEELKPYVKRVDVEAVQASMLHNGSAGYLKDSAPSRRLREAYFYANLTPTVKHLEKVLYS